LTFGFITAGQHGWGDMSAWIMLSAGVVLLVAFVFWQRQAAYPLISLSLFTDRWFSWGTIFATMVSFGLFGLLFAVPQFFQAIGGATPLGTGVRLLPMIGGLLVGTRLAGRLVNRAGARPVIILGFVILAAGLALGATSTRTTGYGTTAVWITLVGAGLGAVLPASMNVALGALSAERAGSGSALISTLRQAGGTIGVAVLGTILNSGYRSQLGSLDKPPINDSVSVGVTVTKALGQPDAVSQVQSAFTHGMDVMLTSTAILCAAAAILAALVLPRGRAKPANPNIQTEEQAPSYVN
jgi:predicted MFS family arabinose efflux permease